MMLTEPQHYLKDGGLVRQPGDGTVLADASEQIEIRLRSEDTGGAWALVEHILAPGSAGPPLQVNTGEDRLFYVLEGALSFQVGARRVELGVSSMGYVPRGTVHGYGNPYCSPVRFLDLICPAGYERFFEERAVAATRLGPEVPADLRPLIAVLRKFGGIFVGPPLPVPTPPLPPPAP